MQLQHALAAVWGMPVSVLNTGHLGYAPEQYYQSLLAYGDRFRPHFVVISVCPNDFGDGLEVMGGRGREWEEAGFWLGKIAHWSRSRAAVCLMAPVANLSQFEGARRDGRYPGPVCDLARDNGIHYVDPTDEFCDEHLRLKRLNRDGRPGIARLSLYNDHIHDFHFSPLGSALWAKVIARRVDLIVNPGLLDRPPRRAGEHREADD